MSKNKKVFRELEVSNTCGKSLHEIKYAHKHYTMFPDNKKFPEAFIVSEKNVTKILTEGHIDRLKDKQI